MAKKRSTPGYASGKFSAAAVPDYVVAELAYDSSVVIEARGRARFAAPPEAASRSNALNTVLGAFDIKRVAPHFDLPQTVLASRAIPLTARQPRVTSEYAHAGFVQIVPRHSKDAPRIAEKLQRSRAVWKAYVAPRPEPAAVLTGSQAGSRNFEPAQGYLHSPPNGIGAMHVWPRPGGKGQGIRICDIEGNWQFTHEDLPAGIPLVGGTLINDLGWRNHGTAVLGEMVSKPGQVGTVGIAHGARALVHSAVVGGVFNAAAAIAGAAATLSAGDVILIELHAIGGPNNKYLAMQYWPDIFSAIVAATAKGITVVEAAGNGNENFDLPAFKNTGLQKDSGAIVVGAGIPQTDFFDTDNSYGHIGVPRSRIWFSNYGRIVNVHGWGWHVTTTGYGDAQGGGSENAWYTHRFSGTSSASPIVTGAVAVLQGIAKAKKGNPLTPKRVRTILMQSGTPQVAGPGVPKSQRIGPLPDLTKAVKLI